MHLKVRDKLIVGKIQKDSIGLSVLNLKRTVIGIQSTSFCEEGKNFLMLDYDDISLSEVIQDVKRLQKQWNLPDIYIFKSSKKEGVPRYHAYCFTPLDFFEHLKILNDSRVDERYKDIFMHEKKSTLRITSKLHREQGIPELIEVVERDSDREEIPNAPLIVNRILYKVKNEITSS